MHGFGNVKEIKEAVSITLVSTFNALRKRCLVVLDTIDNPCPVSVHDQPMKVSLPFHPIMY